MADGKGEHRTARLKRKPGKRANVQAHVAGTARKRGRPQVANDSHGITPKRLPKVHLPQGADEATST
jgi:hypothetical protein